MFLGLGLSLTGLRGGALDAYAIGGFSPKLVFDPVGDAYRTGGSATTFAGMIDYTGASNKTMVDSDGVLKWAPHNLLTYSEDFSNATWAKANATVTANAAIAPDGTTTADKITDTAAATVHSVNHSIAVLQSTTYTLTFYAKAAEKSWITLDPVYPTVANNITYFDLSNGVVGTSDPDNSTVTITSVGNGWYKCSLRHTTGIGQTAMNFQIALANGNNAISYTGNGIDGALIWGAHLYRSDLGGMADNPDTGDSYVPTTSAARYLSRRGHHVYEGGEWVNAGMLVEPTAATNLVTDSRKIKSSVWGGGAAIADANGMTGEANAASSLTGSFSNSRTWVQTVADDSTYYTASTFIKKETSVTAYPGLVLSYSGGTQVRKDITFNPITGATLQRTGQIDGGVAFVEDHGDWWRVIITVQNNSTGNTTLAFDLFPAVATTFSAAWGTAGPQTIVYDFNQLENSAIATSPIPTPVGSTATRAAETVSIAAAKVPYSATAMSIAMRGRMTYADTNSFDTVGFYRWFSGAAEIYAKIDTDTFRTGRCVFRQNDGVTQDFVLGGNSDYSPGINVPFSIASRHGSTFINGAVDGTALTADLTPTSLPNLSATNLSLAQSGGPMIIEQFTMFDADLGDSGIGEASA